MVVLSLAASQLGPRLIKTFMSNQRTKDYFGMFFATVVACFVLTIILHSRNTSSFTPQITISLVFMMCFINLFVLLGFVHHVAQSCIADNVIKQVADDLKDALCRLTTNGTTDNEESQKDTSDWPEDFEEKSKKLIFEQSGYVQLIDYEQLLDIATDNDLYIRINFKAGHFLIQQEESVFVRYPSKPSEVISDVIINRIKETFIIGDTRTQTQDIEYSIRHLVEIAVRALSPGINDSFTAISVLDKLSEAMAILFEKQTRSDKIIDDKGTKRIEAISSDEADIIFTAFDQIRYNAQTMPSVMRHLLKILKVLSEMAEKNSARSALRVQAEGVKQSLNSLKAYVPDHKQLEQQTEDLIKALS